LGLVIFFFFFFFFFFAARVWQEEVAGVSSSPLFTTMVGINFSHASHSLNPGYPEPCGFYEKQ